MHVNRRAFLTAALALPVVALGWPLTAGATEQAAPLERMALAVHGAEGPHRVDAEIARTPAQRQRGLMGRDHLPADHGMLFMYSREQAAGNGFWMFQTLIPLDIAFINNEGRIVAIRTMQPCDSPSPSDCRAYTPGTSYAAALEVNAGYFAKRGIRVGDCVALPGAGPVSCSR